MPLTRRCALAGLAAAAAVPLVPLTVRPTTLLAVGRIVFCRVLPGTSMIQVPQVAPELQLRLPLPSFWSQLTPDACAVGSVSV